MSAGEKPEWWRVCRQCQRAFPGDLVSNLEISDGYVDSSTPLCPLCALKTINKALGVPLETPFKGEIAQAMHQRAVAYLRVQRKKNRKEAT